MHIADATEMMHKWTKYVCHASIRLLCSHQSRAVYLSELHTVIYKYCCIIDVPSCAWIHVRDR